MKDLNKIKGQKIIRRRIRTRVKMQGTAVKPRVTVFRSLLHIYAQAINDNAKTTIAAASDQELKKSAPRQELALAVGELLGQKLQAKKISQVIFDRGAYKYHGRVKALADGARKGGLKF